jgi:hypothetical protein
MSNTVAIIITVIVVTIIFIILGIIANMKGERDRVNRLSK